MKFSFFLFFIFLLAVQVVSATPTFQVDTLYDFKRPCFNNGSFCSAAATCNITMLYPGGAILKDNQLMTNQGSYHNITIVGSENDRLGIHRFIISCTDGKLSGEETGDIDITADGNDFNIFPQQFVIILLGFALIGIGLFKEELRMFKHMGSVIVFVMGLLTLYPGYSFINWSTLQGKAMGFTFIGLGFYFFIEDSFSRDFQEERFSQGGFE
jgi:hypothetical protein